MAESSPNFGGQQHRLVREATWLHAHGQAVLVLCGADSRLAAFLARHAPEVPVEKIPNWRSPRALAEFLRVARRWRPDVIHVRSAQDSFWGCVLRAAGWKIVRSRHMLLPVRMGWRRAFPYRHGCTRVMAAAEAIRTAFVERLKIPPDRVDVVGEGVDLAEFHPGANGAGAAVRAELGIPADAVVFGLVAMVRGEKGHWRFVNAAARVARRFPAARFLLVGDGPPAQVEKLRAKIRKMPAPSPVVFAGYREDVPAVMAALDVLVVPSMEDAQTLVVPQAFATGRPVIASRVGGIPELVADEKNGLLVEPGNEEALAAAMARLAESPDLRATLGRAGLALARSELGFDAKMALLLDCYRRAAAAHRCSS